MPRHDKSPPIAFRTFPGVAMVESNRAMSPLPGTTELAHAVGLSSKTDTLTSALATRDWAEAVEGRRAGRKMPARDKVEIPEVMLMVVLGMAVLKKVTE